jgi:hypothetical protein
MSESSRVALASPAVVDDVEQRPVRSGRRCGSIFAAGVTALAGFVAISCGTNRGESSTSDNTAAATTTERPFCTDASELPSPIVEGDKVFLAVHSDCTGNPNDPSGFYKPSNTPSQLKENALGVIPNNGLIEPDCQVKGEYIRTDAVTDPNARGESGSDIWIRGNVPSHPEWGQADVPATLLGYPGDALAMAYEKQDLPQPPPCPPV